MHSLNFILLNFIEKRQMFITMNKINRTEKNEVETMHV